MNHRMLLVVASLFCAAPAWADSNTATLRAVSDHRNVQVVKDDDSYSQPSSLELKVRLAGPDLVKARQMGNIKIIKAVDNLKADLTKLPPDAMTFDHSELRDIQWDFGGDKKDHKWLDVDLSLPASPARSATTIKTLEASVDLLTGGEEKTIEVTDIPSHYGKALEDPALKAIGLAITLKAPAKAKEAQGPAGKEVAMEIKGDPALAKIEIVDAKGERISNGSMWNDVEGVRTISYYVEDKLPVDAKVKITCWPGQKRVTVPIKLSEIKLP